MSSILIVEDEVDLREMLSETLEQAGYTTYSAGNIGEARKLLERHLPDLVLLDWMLPDTTGLNWLRQIRRIERFRALPVIMLTARGEVGDRVAGLDGGADDYIVKPFSLKELQARIRSQLRHQQPSEDQERLELGGLILDSGTHRVMAGPGEITLGPTEFRLLRHFMSNPDRVYSRSQLLDSVWGHQVFIEERTVDVHIRRLRKALEPSGKAGLIQTVRGAGYRFSLRG
ncbi:MAG: phosphate regulon transcriptional regulator PhoB [Gammaproteobacteria bacterium]|jgi:two-component system phosphate regulon response regulator PhoB